MSSCVTEQPYPYYKPMTEVSVKVRPDSDRFEIEKGYITVIKPINSPENGRANHELKEKMCEITGERPGIVSGHHSRRKKLKIEMSKKDSREKNRGLKWVKSHRTP